MRPKGTAGVKEGSGRQTGKRKVKMKEEVTTSREDMEESKEDPQGRAVKKVRLEGVALRGRIEGR